jgi:hypothetical protein
MAAAQAFLHEYDSNACAIQIPALFKIAKISLLPLYRGQVQGGCHLRPKFLTLASWPSSGADPVDTITTRMADMQQNEQNATRILSYLEDKMTPAEEEAFIRDLDRQDDLRRQYEDELAIRKNDLLLQPADDHLDMIEAALTARHRRFRLIAAILAAIGLAAFLLFQLMGKLR